MTHLTRNTTLLFLIRASDLKTKKFFLPRKLLVQLINQGIEPESQRERFAALRLGSSC